MATAPIKAQAFLANLPLFKELAPDELERVAGHTRQVRATRGEILFHRGDPANGFYLVVYGQVKLAFISSKGDEKVVEIIGPGSSFGEAVMFMEKPHVVTAQVLADTLLLYVQREAVFDELARDTRFARRIIAGLSRRLHHLMGDLEAYSMRSGTQRVIGFLLREFASGEEPSGEIEVTLPTTKGIVASRLNLTQEHFSRILHELSAEGLIEVQGRAVRILDVERLKQYAM
ncbi:MAG: Crp/Fnr family transcriptional regulator [Burkholderiales bacterium]|nr:Crp/Fnr family transcriptional regulator [Burkholderiales bacterium]